MDAERARLSWACRRGMLELDLLLEAFMAQGYDALTAEQRAVLERLLETGDQQLLGWLMGHEEPDEKDFIPVIEAIRAST
ncbi:MAG: succinate dehydrogenase assembly factor 2 [Gammaproteobacteria bacterium]|nr:succinate dehydrogenase assembly factor 2 [Gammaproteobacteria bacterium]